MARHMKDPLAYPAAEARQQRRPISKLVVAAMLAIFAALHPASAQDRNQSNELYHIFDLKTAAPKRDMIAAAGAGLKRNTSDAQTMTPIVMGTPPETPGRFTIRNPLEGGASMGGIAAMIPASQLAQFKQASCDGAVWIANALRKVRGSQTLRLTLCLFPYQQGYQLNVYGIDVKEQGGGISARLGRALAEQVVGKPDGWTEKTILDVVREIRAKTGATVSYVEGQPEIAGTPWEVPAAGVGGEGAK